MHLCSLVGHSDAQQRPCAPSRHRTCAQLARRRDAKQLCACFVTLLSSWSRRAMRRFEHLPIQLELSNSISTSAVPVNNLTGLPDVTGDKSEIISQPLQRIIARDVTVAISLLPAALIMPIATLRMWTWLMSNIWHRSPRRTPIVNLLLRKGEERAPGDQRYATNRRRKMLIHSRPPCRRGHVLAGRLGWAGLDS